MATCRATAAVPAAVAKCRPSRTSEAAESSEVGLPPPVFLGRSVLPVDSAGAVLLGAGPLSSNGQTSRASHDARLADGGSSLVAPYGVFGGWVGRSRHSFPVLGSKCHPSAG